MPNTVHDRRVLAAWRARACAAGAATGAMIFSVGAGVAVPVSLNAAALSSLPALALCGLCAWRAQRVLVRPARAPGRIARAVLALLAVTLCLCAAYIAGAQVCLAEYTLLTRARIHWIVLITLAGLFACTACGGAAVERLCFAVRWALPALLLALGAKALQKGSPIGLFPVLGAGAAPLLVSALCMLSSAAATLCLLCGARDPARETPVPCARFFVVRVLAGGAMGALLLLSLTLCNTYDTLLSQGMWGERMLVTCTHEPRLGVPQMALVLTQMLGLSLGAAALLCAAERAAARAMAARSGEPRGDSLPRLACLILTGAALLAMSAAGFNRAAYFAPVLAVPALLLLALCGHLAQGKEESACAARSR